MKELELWKFMKLKLEEHIPLIFLCVLESSGSSPGRQGFKMVITSNEIIGSIGGGIMEHKFVELAKEKLLEQQFNSITKKQIHSKNSSTNQSGMICSGEQTVFLYPIQKKDAEHIAAIQAALENNISGVLQLNSDGLSFYAKLLADIDYRFELKSDTNWEYEEKIGYKNFLYIIGGGHCSLALSKIMSMLGFYIHVFDERKNLNTMVQNKFANKTEELKSYEELKNKIPKGNSIYVVVMTFSYRTDAIVLRMILNQTFRYVGLLGSVTKVKKLLTELENEGHSKEKLNALHAPIGIQIKSQTPDEIAVSIAAEIIKTKNAHY